MTTELTVDSGVTSDVAPLSVEPTTVSTPVVADVGSTEPVTTTESKPKRARKPKAEKAKGKGRPPVFVGDVRKGIVKLIRKHKNATRVREILNATKRHADLVALREAAGLTEKVSISMPTLLKIAADAGIELHRGRPVVKKAA